MNPFRLSGFLCGKVAFLTALGFGAMFVVPIVLGIAATIMPFLLVGVLAYGPWMLFRAFFVTKIETPAVAVPPIVEELPPVIPIKSTPIRRLSSPRYVLARALGEVVCGTLIGTILGALANWQNPGMYNSAALGAGLGTVAGFMVGFLDGGESASERERATEVV